MNFGDYIEDGLTRIVGVLPGGKFSTEELLAENYRKREAKDKGETGYIDVMGNYKLFPKTGIAPLPGLKDWNSLYQQVANTTKITAGSADKIYKFRRATDGADRFVAGK
jgi:hypothetical protein